MSAPALITADTGGRYFMLPMLDMWTDVFAVPGKCTNGTGPANFALIPPGWTGHLPEGVEAIHAPTPYVWIVGRTQTNGVKDYDAVHKIQGGYKITFLADWGKTPRKVEQKIDPNVDVKTDPLKHVNTMPAIAYFKYGAELMKVNPPHLSDWSINARMKRIGLAPGKSLDDSRVSADVLARGAAAGLQLMREKMPMNVSTLITITSATGVRPRLVQIATMTKETRLPTQKTLNLPKLSLNLPTSGPTKTVNSPVMLPCPVPGPARSSSRGSSPNTVGV